MRLAATALLFVLAACASPPTMVQVGADTWMIAIPGGDPTCVAYRLQSATQATVQSLFYRKRDGSFVMSRMEACGAP